MKNRTKEKMIRQGSENPFHDLGFGEVEGANLKLRSDLMIVLREYIREHKWTQVEAAQFFHVTQPRISNLMNGEIDRFSIDNLVLMLARADMRLHIEIVKKAA